MTKIFVSLLIYMLVLGAISCTSQEPINLKPFPMKNIPQRDFKISIDKLHDTIASIFSFKNRDENKILDSIFYYYGSENVKHTVNFITETKENTVFGKKYFANPNTSEDIYVQAFNFWPSKLYFSGKNQLDYTTQFIIKLTKIDAFLTRVNVLAESSKVINGTTGYSAHGAVARETPVAPTTIEEYCILLFVASKLGDTSMLPIKLPSD